MIEPANETETEATEDQPVATREYTLEDLALVALIDWPGFCVGGAVLHARQIKGAPDVSWPMPYGPDLDIATVHSGLRGGRWAWASDVEHVAAPEAVEGRGVTDG